jgi:hypothetical protein
MGFLSAQEQDDEDDCEDEDYGSAGDVHEVS